MKRHFVLRLILGVLGLAISATGATPEPPSPVRVSLQALPPWDAHGYPGPYRVDPYIKAAMYLQSMRRADAGKALLDLARYENSQRRNVVILCRMLFTTRPGRKFRAPGFGGSMYLASNARASDWPREPIALVDGVPFVIVVGYDLDGRAEFEDDYVRYCIRNCDWNSYRFQTRNPQQKQDALRKLVASPKWRHPLEGASRDLLAAQIE
jgi:hypothetical protein